VGANHQPFIRGGAIGRGHGASLGRFQGGNLGADPFLYHLAGKGGITVNAIAATLIHTERMMKNPKTQPSLVPVGRFGTVEEVAAVAVLLAENGYIAGQTINVNGGWYMS
jgi:3-oxoacyl-[acyl-carrier protein] reductase